MEIGIAFEYRSVRIAHVEPGSPAERMGLRRGDRLTHVGGIPVCNRDQIAATWQLRDELPRDDISVLRMVEVLRIPIPDGLDAPLFAPDVMVDLREGAAVLDLRERQAVVAAGLAS